LLHTSTVMTLTEKVSAKAIQSGTGKLFSIFLSAAHVPQKGMVTGKGIVTVDTLFSAAVTQVDRPVAISVGVTSASTKDAAKLTIASFRTFSDMLRIGDG
jgi:hypothetical protein